MQLSVIGNSGERAAARNRHGVILAGGEGSRLRSLTRIIEGDERPKQFCHILNGQSLLEVTKLRTSLVIDPGNIHYSLTEKHAKYFRPILSDVPEAQLHVQPSNRGTAPALLYSLVRLAETSPDACVGFFPSDHYFTDDRQIMEEVERAFRIVESGAAEIVLLGMEPTTAETSYGWIEPADSLFGSVSASLTSVQRFWEKPDRATAGLLLDRGGLWNSFIMVGRVATFLAQFEKHLPDLYRAFSVLGGGTSKRVLGSVYNRAEDTNFSSEVLERSAGSLHVLRVGDVGWSDLGEPQRVLGTLTTLGVNADWMAYAA